MGRRCRSATGRCDPHQRRRLCRARLARHRYRPHHAAAPRSGRAQQLALWATGTLHPSSPMAGRRQAAGRDLGRRRDPRTPDACPCGSQSGPSPAASSTAWSASRSPVRISPPGARPRNSATTPEEPLIVMRVPSVAQAQTAQYGALLWAARWPFGGWAFLILAAATVIQLRALREKRRVEVASALDLPIHRRHRQAHGAGVR